MTQPNKPPPKPSRVHFPKGWTAEHIFNEIKKQRDEWAKRNPEKAHKLYPDKYSPSQSK